jgi:Family of unknown function (DUF6171)
LNEKMTPFQQAQSVFRVAVESGAAMARGESPTVNERLQNQRLRECYACPQLTNGTCSMCGCVVAFKTRVKAATCPMGKW